MLTQLKEEQNTLMRKAFMKSGENSQIGFKICNKKDVPLQSYSFYVSGYEQGRSSAHGLGEYDSSSTRLEGDIIIKPNQCGVITWTRKYKFFSRYETSIVLGNWDNSK